MQSKTHSLIEACANTASGFVLSFLLGLIVYPMYGMTVSTLDTLGITVLFTVVSVVRSYVWRRLFNRHTVALATKGSAEF